MRNLNSLTYGLTNIHDLLPRSIDTVIAAINYVSTMNVDGSQRFFEGSILTEAHPSKATVEAKKMRRFVYVLSCWMLLITLKRRP